MAIKPHFVHYVVLAALAVVLSGCTSSPKLSTPPAGRTGASNSQKPGDASGQTSGVNGDSLSGPPASVGRVVYFDFDSATVKPEYQGLIDQQARYLRSRSASHVVLEGNTDERGSREYNLALGQKRADAVKRSLLLLGAREDQLESVSLGKEKPRNPGSGEEAWAENRRADILYRAPDLRGEF